MKVKRLSSNKVLIFSLISVVMIGLIGVRYQKVKAEELERDKIFSIEEMLLQGNYDEAIIALNDCDDLKNYELNNKVIVYKYVINSYKELKVLVERKNLKESLFNFKERHKDSLSLDVFKKLNEDILAMEDEVKNYFDNIEKSRNIILDKIENDIDSAKIAIEEFKANYPSEDITDLESLLNNKLEEIARTNEVKEDIPSVDTITKTIADTAAAKNSSQIVTVVSNGGSYAELVMWEKNSTGQWIEVDRVGARLGQNGMKHASEVYEMDKCTPTGIYSLTEAFGINGNPGSGVPYRELDGSEYWVDDVDSEYYNTMQFGEADGRWNSAEKLIDFSGYYNYALVIDYNRWPVVPGKSSAIFLHCDLGIYTYGCVAIPQRNLVDLLTWLNPASNPVIIMDFTYEDIYNNY